MPGTFSRDNRPLLPGPYFDFDATVTTPTPTSAGGVVALPIVHDWGPFEQARQVSSLAAFDALYGNSDTAGRRAVQQAFVGEGVPGFGGAGAVLVYRMGRNTTNGAGAGTVASKASKNIANTAGTPVTNALAVTALYEGSFGNQLKVSIVPNAANPGTSNDFILYRGATEVERYTYTIGDVAGLSTSINSVSNWISTVSNATGTPLNISALSTPSALTGGDDGSSLLTSDWTAMTARLEPERFGIFVPYDLTDGTIVTALKVWAQALNAAGKRFRSIFGGDINDTITTAIASTANSNGSAALADPDIIRVGVGSYADEGIIGTLANPVTLTTSQLAPRIAGIAAGRGEVDSMTYARLYGLRILVGPTEANKLTALKNGVIVIGRDSDALAPVRLEKAVTTFSNTTDATRPYLIYRNPKFVATMHGIQMEFTEWVEGNIVGRVTVNDRTRGAVMSELASRLNARARLGVIQSNFSVAVDQNPPASDDDEFLAYIVGLSFGRSAEQVYFTIKAA